jgi:hypothetical protein
MILDVLHLFNLHSYDAFLNLEKEIKRLKHCNKKLYSLILQYYDALLNLKTEIKRLKHCNKNLKQRKNLFRDIAKNKKREEILHTYSSIKRIDEIVDAYIVLESIFI